MFEVFFDSGKEIEVARRQVWRIWWMWHRNHAPCFPERFCDHAPVNRAVVDVHNQSLSMQISSLGTEGMVERLKNLRGTTCPLDFGTSREPIDDMEPM
jgi:hypothetical protein